MHVPAGQSFPVATGVAFALGLDPPSLLAAILFYNFFTSFKKRIIPILCIFSCVCVTYNCTVHGADLTYISLLIMFCIIVCDE